MKKMIFHILVHCSKAMMLWNILLSLVGVYSNGFFLGQLENPSFVAMDLLWARSRKRLGWKHHCPTCEPFGMKEKKIVFNNEKISIHRIYTFSLCKLWSSNNL